MARRLRKVESCRHRRTPSLAGLTTVKSQRQEEAFESANNDIMNNHFFEAFYEVYDFVEDYNARKSEILYKEEAETDHFLDSCRN